VIIHCVPPRAWTSIDCHCRITCDADPSIVLASAAVNVTAHAQTFLIVYRTVTSAVNAGSTIDVGLAESTATICDHRVRFVDHVNGITFHPSSAFHTNDQSCCVALKGIVDVPSQFAVVIFHPNSGKNLLPAVEISMYIKLPLIAYISIEAACIRSEIPI